MKEIQEVGVSVCSPEEATQPVMGLNTKDIYIEYLKNHSINTPLKAVKTFLSELKKSVVGSKVIRKGSIFIQIQKYSPDYIKYNLKDNEEPLPILISVRALGIYRCVYFKNDEFTGHRIEMVEVEDSQELSAAIDLADFKNACGNFLNVCRENGDDVNTVLKVYVCSETMKKRKDYQDRAEHFEDSLCPELKERYLVECQHANDIYQKKRKQIDSRNISAQPKASIITVLNKLAKQIKANLSKDYKLSIDVKHYSKIFLYIHNKMKNDEKSLILIDILDKEQTFGPALETLEQFMDTNAIKPFLEVMYSESLQEDCKMLKNEGCTIDTYISVRGELNKARKDLNKLLDMLQVKYAKLQQDYEKESNEALPTIPPTATTPTVKGF